MSTKEIVAPKVNWAEVAKAVTFAFKEMARVIKAAMRVIRQALKHWHKALVTAANAEVWVSGLEARAYVRGALTCNGIEDVVGLSKQIMQDPRVLGYTYDERTWLRLLTRESRGRVAAAAIRGHVESVYSDAPKLLAWHRLMGSTAVQVGRGV